MGKIERAAAAAGETAETYIPRIIEEEGTVHKAAIRIGVYPNTINFWLRRNNMRLVTERVAHVERVKADA